MVHRFHRCPQASGVAEMPSIMTGANDGNDGSLLGNSSVWDSPVSLADH